MYDELRKAPQTDDEYLFAVPVSVCIGLHGSGYRMLTRESERNTAWASRKIEWDATCTQTRDERDTEVESKTKCVTQSIEIERLPRKDK